MEAKATDNSLASVLNDEEALRLFETKSILKAYTDLKIPMDDPNLLRYLRYRKNNAKEAAECARKFWIMFGTLQPYKEIIIPSSEKLDGASRAIILRGRDKNGCQIVVGKLGKWEPSKVSMMETFVVNVPILGTVSERQLTQLNGVSLIIDCDGFGTEHILHSSPRQLKQIVEMVNVTPMLLKAIHVINNPVVFNAIWTIIRTFLKEKIKKRVRFHGYNFVPTLHKHIDPELLPKCYGGLLDDDNFGEEGFEEFLLGTRQYFEDCFNTSKYGYTKQN